MRTWPKALAAAALVAAAARGQQKLEIADLTLESLLDPEVVAASRRVERASDAPATVFVLTADDIRRQGFRSIAEAVASIPGLFISDQRSYQFVGVRGFNIPDDNSSHVLVLVDGHALNNSGFVNTFLSRDLPVTLGALDRIEVIFGPVGGVYGPFAFFAVINLVTSAGRGESSAFVAGDTDGAGPNGFEAGVTVDRQLGGLGVFLHAGVYRSGGHDFAFPELASPGRALPPGGAVPGTDASEAQNVYARLRYSDLTLSLGFATRRHGDPFASYGTIAGDTRNEWLNRVGFVQLAWEKQVSPAVRLLARVSFDAARSTDRFVYPDPPVDIGTVRDFAKDTWWSGELRAELRPFEKTRVTVGFEGQAHDTLQRFTADLEPDLSADPIDGVGTDPVAKAYRTLNGHALVEQGLGAAFSLQAGLNLYTSSAFGERVTAKLATVFRPAASDSFKLLWSQGFRPPTIGEAFFDDAKFYTRNPGLKSEHADSIEAVWEHRFGAVTSLRVNVFQSFYRDLIAYRSVPAPDLGHEPSDATDYRLQAQNVDSANVLGAEAAFRVQFGSALQGYGGLSISRSTLAPDAAEAANFAQGTAAVALSTRLPWEPLTISVNAQAVSARRQAPMPGEVDPPSAPAYLKLNASARLAVPGAPGLFAQATILNLLGTPVTEPLPTDQAPLRSFTLAARSFRFLLEYRR